MKDFSSTDKVFAKPLSSVKAFEFDEQVARVFDDMITRSVPGYEVLLKLIALYADIFVTRKSRVYDLGCSTGMVSRIIARQVEGRACEVVAVDNSVPMIEQCRELNTDLDISWLCQDVQLVELKNASLVVLNLTLQFIEPDQRQLLLGRIYNALNPGGALVLTEKVEQDDALLQSKYTELYQGFKKLQGYSDLEISQKRSALEQVLIPDKKSLHPIRLHQLGFNEVMECFHCFNFTSYLAVK